MDVSKVERLAKHTLDFLYARALLELLPSVVQNNCYGCEVGHPSQTHHTCLMWTTSEHLDVYFEVTLNKIEQKDIVAQLKIQVNRMDIPEDHKKEFAFNLEDWCGQHKPNPDTLLNMCQKLLLLDDRFETNLDETIPSNSV